MKVSAAAFLSLDSGSRYRFRDGDEVGEIERRMPSRIVFPVSNHADALRAIAKRGQAFKRLLHLLFAANDAHERLHHLLKCVLNMIRAFAGLGGGCAVERL